MSLTLGNNVFNTSSYQKQIKIFSMEDLLQGYHGLPLPIYGNTIIEIIIAKNRFSSFCIVHKSLQVT